MAGAVGQISRVYTNPTKGLTVSVLLLCGLPGNISTHTPDVCYPGAGYTLGNGERFVHRYGVPEQAAEFQTAIASRAGTKPSSPAALLGVAWVQRLVRARESTLGFRCRADALEALHREGNRRSRGRSQRRSLCSVPVSSAPRTRSRDVPIRPGDRGKDA